MACEYPHHNQQMNNLTQGSVLADITLQTPSNWTAQQVNAAAATMADPTTVFDPTFLATYGITSVTVQLATPLPPLPSGLSDTAKIGIGVGVGVGGAAIVGGAVGAAVARKRRMAVEPRGPGMA